MAKLLQKRQQQQQQQQQPTAAGGSQAPAAAQEPPNGVAALAQQLQARLVKPLVQVKISLMLDTTAWQTGLYATPPVSGTARETNLVCVCEGAHYCECREVCRACDIITH
jgi:hypothetical protein